jgi:type IV pilus assembly protein PilB
MRQQLEPTLRRSGALTSQELEISLGQANAQKISLWDLLIEQRRLPEDTVAEAFSTWLSLPRVRIDSVAIEPAAVKALAGRLARKHTCLPIRLSGKNLVLAMANPLDRKAIQDVEFASSREVQPVVASRAEILLGIEEHYGAAATTGATAEAEPEAFSARVTGERDVLDLDLDATGSLSAEILPAVQLCSRLVVDAIELQASDIHIEPGPQEMRVRLRIDGVLREHLRIPHWMCAALVSRVKVLAKLDIATQRIPQDGRIKARFGERRIDLRVSTLPTQFGEKAVLRLLGSTGAPTLSALGLSAAEMALLDDGLSQPQGLILVTGPTGAGKSTTLYSMLTSRQSTDVNVVTIEDPIEYQVPGATQVQVDGKGGLTFASCLRAILRQDPDVILVGEIRDLETAEVAFRAALTGHLVFSTLHTNSSVGAIERLLDLGVKPLLVTTATNLIVAQRLARRICMNCREPYVPSALALRKLHTKAGAHEFHHGRGCAACAQTGYSGRVGIFEILRLTPRLKELVNRRATESEMTEAALEGGTRLLLEDALYKVRQGLTTVEEILRVIRIEPAQGAGQANCLTVPASEASRPLSRQR